MNELTRLVLCFLSLQAFCCPVSGADWEAKVINNIEALTTSCVVIPCSFKYPGEQKSHSQLRGIWYIQKEKNQEFIYHEDETNVVENFKRRTKILGDLGSKNCTLEIIEFKNHDAGSYCFRIEIPDGNRFSYTHNCAQVSVTDKPEEPKLLFRETAIEGSPYTITCSVIHTCPSHMPKLTWSRGSNEEIITHYKNIGEGKWEVQSLLIFIPNEEDDDSEITCTANFYGGQDRKFKMSLRVKLKAKIFHIIIPVTAVAATAVIFGGLCFLMRRKYKKHITELRTQANSTSLWSRISRLSRRRSPNYFVEEPCRPERRSLWSRFTRRGDPYTMNMNVNYSVNNDTVACGVKSTPKPRFPSPESHRKLGNGGKTTGKKNNEPDDDDYVNTADLNIYGNM